MAASEEPFTVEKITIIASKRQNSVSVGLDKIISKVVKYRPKVKL